MSQDDTAIGSSSGVGVTGVTVTGPSGSPTQCAGANADDSLQIKCENSPPTPRSLRLERVAQALAQSSEDLLQRSVIQPPFVR